MKQCHCQIDLGNKNNYFIFESLLWHLEAFREEEYRPQRKKCPSRDLRNIAFGSLTNQRALPLSKKLWK
jgi:hypothetical protein